ncbi:MAG: plastocyanin/azurin family copper-binding protein [Desulfobacterales bacterium]|nr:plastocyanin/azurin family copper-binding protein [Desulfobacterales bacterium]
MKEIKIILSLILLAFVLSSVGNVTAGTIKGKVEIKGIRRPSNVVVYIDKAPGEFKPPAEHAQMDQKNMAFLPHVLPVVAGTTVDFLNNDEVLHNVFSSNDCAENFNLGTWGKGEARPYQFKNADCNAIILCKPHPEMEAWVVTLQNPYFGKTDKTGAFSIKDVPAGKYTLKLWHKEAKGPDQEVTISQDGEVVLDIKMNRTK